MSAGTMRAAVLAAPRHFEVREVARPTPGPGEVLVQLEGCGVCGSDLVPWQGREWFDYPFTAGAPGHEGWGVVAGLGRGVTGLSEGDRVALVSFAAFAELDVAPLERVVALPRAVAGPFPGEALGCGVNVFRRSAVRPGDTVAVVGAGFLGLVALRLAALAGARVIALSRRETALQLARELGAGEAVALGSVAGEAEEAVRALTCGRMCDVVIEAVGQQGALDLATLLTRPGGRLVLAGFHQDGLRTVDLCRWNWQGLEIVNAHERDPRVQREGVLRAAAEVAEGRLDPRPLYRSFPLERLDAAFQAMEERPEGFVKALAMVAA